ncbi:uncharacterized protein PAC_05381 [Phialocephala subalpina]|uniref:Uncharacterized protein n=1 Tax=Phialocephala subalpina TaxID=576137 RepID=A0A1L7WRU9_9HELO|nr:uncharacterized protein PAC_05381 [Phialocephala subalpina]
MAEPILKIEQPSTTSSSSPSTETPPAPGRADQQAAIGCQNPAIRYLSETPWGLELIRNFETRSAENIAGMNTSTPSVGRGYRTKQTARKTRCRSVTAGEMEAITKMWAEKRAEETLLSKLAGCGIKKKKYDGKKEENTKN